MFSNYSNNLHTSVILFLNPLIDLHLVMYTYNSLFSAFATYIDGDTNN